ncbi:MAG: hypothetical protein FWG50_03255 [Kiritimatiellaeota bacterium]|nr:hypothetical protein [Kiritimatiellota bacterium]
MSDSIEKRVQRGMIVEFDYAVLPGHQLLLDACKEQFKAHELELDATLMARYMFGKSFTRGLNTLAAQQEKMVEDPMALITACNAALSKELTAALPSVPEGFLAFVRGVLGKGVKVVIISRANADAVRALFPDAGEKLVVQTDTSSGFGFLGWDVWRRAARKNELRERLCVAVTGSGFSVKGVLMSSMGAMYKENPLVAYQDFSGGDVAIRDFDVSLVKDVARILRI